MNPRDVVTAVLTDDLTARQLVKDAKREGFRWSQAPALEAGSLKERAVYASVVELLAQRNGEPFPAWTRGVGRAPEPVYLMGKNSNALKRKFEASAPAVLKARNVYAAPEYLDVL